MLWLLRLSLYTPEEGAYTPIIAAAAPHVRAERESYKGVYLVPMGKIATPTKAARSESLARDLWETSVKVLEEMGVHVE